MKVWARHLPKGRRRSAARSAAGQAGQVRLDGGLVDEDEAAGLASHPRLAMLDPASPGFTDLCAFPLRGDQSLFLYDSPARDSACWTDEM